MLSIDNLARILYESNYVQEVQNIKMMRHYQRYPIRIIDATMLEKITEQCVNSNTQRAVNILKFSTAWQLFDVIRIY